MNTLATGLTGARDFHTATLLQNSQILVVGGFNGLEMASARRVLHSPRIVFWPVGTVRPLVTVRLAKLSVGTFVLSGKAVIHRTMYHTHLCYSVIPSCLLATRSTSGRHCQTHSHPRLSGHILSLLNLFSELNQLWILSFSTGKGVRVILERIT